MSDYYIKIIPQEPYYMVDEDLGDRVVAFLQNALIADAVDHNPYDHPVFIDCGGELERISCPRCGKALSFEWWGEAMDDAGADGFRDLYIKTPCCETIMSLNDLEYHLPCGFASEEFSVMNPDDDPPDEVIDTVSEMIGTPVTVIRARI